MLTPLFKERGKIFKTIRRIGGLFKMNTKKCWILLTITWIIVIYFFTELPSFNGQSTAAVINKTVVTNEITNHVVSPSTGSLITLNELNILFRKSAHIFVFGVLAMLIFKCLEPRRHTYLLAWVLTVFYAIFDEWHQSFIPGRVATMKDVMFDSFGALVALLLMYFFVRLKRHNYSS
jgi:VanZ family protein